MPLLPLSGWNTFCRRIEKNQLSVIGFSSLSAKHVNKRVLQLARVLETNHSVTDVFFGGPDFLLSPTTYSVLLPVFATLPRLNRVSLESSNITDTNCAQIVGLVQSPFLKILHLRHTKIKHTIAHILSALCVPQLETQLEELSLPNIPEVPTRVTKLLIKVLAANLPLRSLVIDFELPASWFPKAIKVIRRSNTNLKTFVVKVPMEYQEEWDNALAKTGEPEIMNTTPEITSLDQSVSDLGALISELDKITISSPPPASTFGSIVQMANNAILQSAGDINDKELHEIEVLFAANEKAFQLLDTIKQLPELTSVCKQVDQAKNEFDSINQRIRSCGSLKEITLEPLIKERQDHAKTCLTLSEEAEKAIQGTLDAVEANLELLSPVDDEFMMFVKVPEQPTPLNETLREQFEQSRELFRNFCSASPSEEAEGKIRTKLQEIQEDYQTILQMFQSWNSVSSTTSLFRELANSAPVCCKSDEALTRISTSVEEVKLLLSIELNTKKAGLSPILKDARTVASHLAQEIQKLISSHEQLRESLLSSRSEYRTSRSFFQNWFDKEGELITIVERITTLREEFLNVEDELVAQKAILDRATARGRATPELTSNVENLRRKFSTMQKDLRVLQSTLANLASIGGYPELRLMYSSHVLSDSVSTTGLVVDKTLADFDSVEVIVEEGSHKIFKCTKDDRVSAVKEYELVNEKHRKGFDREVTILHRAKSELVMPIESVFYFNDPERGLLGYLQMPWIAGGNLESWLKTAPSPEKIRSVMRMILQGISYLHVSGILHRDLKFSSILMDKNNKPIITSFDIGKDQAMELTSSILIVSNSEWAAPEVIEGYIPYEASDIYSFGVMLLKCHFPDISMIALLNQHGELEIPPCYNQNLSDLLLRLLETDPKRRLSADEALVHPYFLAVQEASQDSSAARIEALTEHLRAVRVAKSASLGSVTRHFNQIVSDNGSMKLDLADVFSKCANMSENELFGPFSITFDGEDGIDAGGLTTAFYDRFFTQVFEEQVGMFERAEMDTYLPRAFIPQEREQDFKTFGNLVAKCLYEGRLPSVKFAPVVFKYILDGIAAEVTFSDFEMYDIKQSRHLRQLLNSPGAEYLYLTFENLITDGDKREVTDANKHEFVSLTIRYELLEKRIRALQKIREGFFQIPIFEKHLKLFTHFDLTLLMLGEQHLQASDIKNTLVADSDLPNAAQMIGFFNEVLDRFTVEELRLFLHFITTEVAIPVGGLRNPSTRTYYAVDKITIYPVYGSVDTFPISHTCWYRLDVPDYPTADMLYDKLIAALKNHQMSAGAFFIG